MKLSGNLAQVNSLSQSYMISSLGPGIHNNVWSDLVLEVITAWPSSLSLNSPWPSLSFYLELSLDLPFLKNKCRINSSSCFNNFPIFIKVTRNYSYIYMFIHLLVKLNICLDLLDHSAIYICINIHTSFFFNENVPHEIWSSSQNSLVTFVLFLEWASHFCEGLYFLLQPPAQILSVIGFCWWGQGNATPWNKQWQDIVMW